LRIFLIFLNSFLLLVLFLASQFYPVKFFDKLVSKNFDKFLILSVIKVESNFNPKAESYTGAYGLMQVLPSTAKWLNQKYGLNYNYKDSEDNIKLGILYLDYLYELTNDIEDTLVFYNTGPNATNEVKRDSGNRYLKKVKRTYFIYKFLYRSD